MAISGQAITLANSIIGVGILAMPYCFKQCGIILSILLLLISGLMSRLACHFLLKSAIKSRRRNFEVLAFHVFGNAGKFAVEIGIIGFLMGTCIAYFVVVGDLGPQIIAKMLNINQSNVLRTSVMIIVSVVCVLPLGLLKDVDSLSNVCAVTIGFYFCLVLKVVAEAMSQMLEGDWLDKVEYWQPSGLLQCLPIFSMSLFCQTQLFEIYDTLPNASLEKMNSVTKNAVTICSMVYVLVGLFGYIAFCNQNISGNILTNLSPTMASDAIKMGFVMSLAFSFPLIIFPCRASLYSLLYKKGQVSPYDLLSNMIPDFRFKCLTVGIIAVTLLIGLMLPNIELVLGFIGSTIGVMICVIFPAMCFICITVKNTNERMLAQLVLCFGIIIMVLGTYANLQAAEIESIHFKYEAKIEHNSYVDNNVIKPKLNVDNVKTIETDKNILKSFNSIEKNLKENLVISKEKIEKSDDKKINKLENLIKPKDNVVQIDLTKLEDPKPQKQDIKLDNIVKNEDKIVENIKTKDLLETIKRHEEEQRQIMNEQKEILKEMKKTKDEIEKENMIKKSEINIESVESKKIAMENIQKLAKIAIESLGGKLDLVVDSHSNKTDDKKTVSEKSIKRIDNEEIVKNNTSIKKDVDLNKVSEKKMEIVEDVKVSKNVGNEVINKLNIILKNDKKETVNKASLIYSTVKNEDKKVEDKDKAVTEYNLGGKRDILEVHKVSSNQRTEEI